MNVEKLNLTFSNLPISLIKVILTNTKYNYYYGYELVAQCAKKYKLN